MAEDSLVLNRLNLPYKVIKLSLNSYCIVDLDDFETLSAYNWCATKSSEFSNKYAYNHKLGRMHRFILKAPKGMVVDHINGNTLDNRKTNLRLCTIPENSRYRKVTLKEGKTSKYKGVYLHKKSQKFHSRIRLNRKYHSLGYFSTEWDAAVAYNKAAIDLFGSFAKLNTL